LALSEPDIRLYDTSSFEATTSIPPDDLPRWPMYPSPTWKSKIHYLCQDSLSQTYLCQHTNTLRLVFATLYAIHGLIIPGDAHLGPEPKVVMLMDFCAQMEQDFFLCYNSAIVHGRGSPLLRMLDYSWPDDTLLGSSNSLTTKLDGTNFCL
jgi:hypothetical protein